MTKTDPGRHGLRGRDEERKRGSVTGTWSSEERCHRGSGGEGQGDGGLYIRDLTSKGREGHSVGGGVGQRVRTRVGTTVCVRDSSVQGDPRDGTPSDPRLTLKAPTTLGI